LFKQALNSTHFQVSKECFDAVLEGYSIARGKETTADVLNKVREIEKRGRYIAERQ
jgi:tRNA A-37 threonylcarbamoyl transferase component Bud32